MRDTSALSGSAATTPSVTLDDCRYAVEVIISRDKTPILASLFLNEIDIGARAVASGEGDGSGEICVLALEVSAEGIGISGSVQLTLPNCGIGVNSSNSRALNITGSAQIRHSLALRPP